jgi:hypothetical protein
LLQTNEYVFSFAGTGNSGTQDNNIVFVRIKAKRTISTTSIKIREVELFDDAGQKAIHIIGITNIEREIEIPSQFCLLQNYPNPFNPTTTINYQLSTNSHIQMKVFDVLGREIITLVDETKGAGDYTVQWNAINFPNGVYYCRLNAGSIMKIVKMILMK